MTKPVPSLAPRSMEAIEAAVTLLAKRIDVQKADIKAQQIGMLFIKRDAQEAIELLERGTATPAQMEKALRAIVSRCLLALQPSEREKTDA